MDHFDGGGEREGEGRERGRGGREVDVQYVFGSQDDQ